MKLLALGPQNAYPPIDGGREGIFGALTALAKNCDLTYAFPCGDGEVNLSGYITNNIEVIPVPFSPRENAGLIIMSILQGRSFKFQKYSSSESANIFSNHIDLKKYDAIICFHAHTWRLAYRLCKKLNVNIPILVREHNIEYEIVGTYLDLMGVLKKLFLYPFYLLTKIDERNIWRSADAVAFLSSHDLKVAIDSGVKGNYFLAPEGIPLPAKRVAKFPGVNSPLLILLNPKALQSVVNVKIFIEEYWIPAINAGHLLGVELHITGVKTQYLEELWDIPRGYLVSKKIKGLGFVENLQECFEGSLALISPAFSGGGIRKKILEAMANQLPVIATQLDIDSCDYFKKNQNILELDKESLFSEKINFLRFDPVAWMTFSNEGRRTVEKNADWDYFGSVIMEKIESLKKGR